MLKRIAHGRPFGVAVLAEGIGLRLPQEELQKAMPEVELDEHGHVRLAELELDRLLAKQVKDRFKKRGQKITVEGKNIGYELRCAPPIPFDIEYTRDLGYSAVDYLKRVLEGDESGGMITIQEGHIVALPFGSFNDPETGRVRIRLVNVESSSYRVAREYMIRLDREDLEDPDKLRPIAAASQLTPGAFRDRYGYLSRRLSPGRRAPRPPSAATPDQAARRERPGDANTPVRQRNTSSSSTRPKAGVRGQGGNPQGGSQPVALGPGLAVLEPDPDRAGPQRAEDGREHQAAADGGEGQRVSMISAQAKMSHLGGTVTCCRSSAGCSRAMSGEGFSRGRSANRHYSVSQPANPARAANSHKTLTLAE